MQPAVADQPDHEADHGPGRRWLAELAGHLRARNTHEVAWWNLHRAIPRWVLRVSTTSTVLLAFLSGLAIVVVSVPDATTAATIIVGAVLGPIVGLTLLRSGRSGQTPDQVRLPSLRHDRRIIAAALTSGAVWSAAPGFVTAVAVYLIFGPVPAVGGAVVVAAIIGSARAVTVAAIAPSGLQQAARPAHLLRQARTAALLSSSLLAIGVSLLTGLAMLLAAPVAVGPAASLTVGTTLGAATGLAAVVHTTWGQFCLVRLLLAAYRHTPIRLMRALDEAHRCGLLRQAGGVYQFCHTRLRDPLAGPTWSGRPSRPA